MSTDPRSPLPPRLVPALILLCVIAAMIPVLAVLLGVASRVEVMPRRS